MKQTLIIVFILATTLFFGCKTDTTSVLPENMSHSNTSGSFELLQKKVLTKSCASSGCHSSENDASFKQHKLILTGPNLYTRLINGDVENRNAKQASLKQIVPKDPEKSFFYQKMDFEGSSHKYGNAMPLGADVLTTKQLKFIKDWIIAGAPKEGHVADEELLLH
ncbi:MAG: hypothetical protein ACRCVT_04400 [Leadbetterella sp.]